MMPQATPQPMPMGGPPAGGPDLSQLPPEVLIALLGQLQGGGVSSPQEEQVENPLIARLMAMVGGGGGMPAGMGGPPAMAVGMPASAAM